MKALHLTLAVLLCTTVLRAEPAVPAMPAMPTTEDFTKLRMAYAAQKDFNPMWKADDARDAIIQAYKAKEYDKVADLAKAWLAKVPVDADIHYVRAQALKKVGDWPGSLFHWHCFYGLVHSIAASGDGKSPKTAYKVISVSEEYYFLDEIGAELVQQSLQMPCDVMHVKFRDGTEATLYFDVSISMQALSRQFEPRAK